MRLKNLNESPPPEGFVFYFLDRHQKEVRVPQVGNANSLAKLVSLVQLSFKNQGIAAPPDIKRYIEHQICLRAPNPLRVCWESGLGDSLHHRIFKPLFNKLDTGLKKVGVKPTKIGSCQGCSGTKVYNPSRGSTNMGRASGVNQIVPY